MSDAPRAIAGMLVDARNVATHRSFRLVIDIPAEEAMKAIEAFGWPTGANPVPVAVARLVSQAGKEVVPDKLSQLPDHKNRAGDGKRQWSDLPPAQQAAIRCNEPTFRQFLNEAEDYRDIEDAGSAAVVVRAICGVSSRADLNTDIHAAARWQELDASYKAWDRYRDAEARAI